MAGLHQTQSPSVARNNEPLPTQNRPEPSDEYIQRAHQPSRRLSQPKKLLIIVDLNGTLLVRSMVGRSMSYTLRPNVKAFLSHCLAHHALAVWSSAKPHNVNKMLDQLFSPEQRARLLRVWTREDLRLGSLYNEHVMAYKQLSWLWDDLAGSGDVDRMDEGTLIPWDQSNTVSVDDSTEKATSEPYNIIEVDEFTARNKNDGDDVLGQVLAYIDSLSCEADVSAAIEKKAFVKGGGLM